MQLTIKREMLLLGKVRKHGEMLAVEAPGFVGV